MRIRGVVEKKTVMVLQRHTTEVDSVAFSPDGKTLASGGKDTLIKLWDVKTGSLMRTLSGHTRSVESLASSPDEKTLVTGESGGDSSVKFWGFDSRIDNVADVNGLSADAKRLARDWYPRPPVIDEPMLREDVGHLRLGGIQNGSSKSAAISSEDVDQASSISSREEAPAMLRLELFGRYLVWRYQRCGTVRRINDFAGGFAHVSSDH